MRTASQHETQVALMRFLSQVATRLGVGEHVYVVGGAVRDFVLDKPIKDVDVVLDVVALGAKRDSEWFAKEVQKQVYAPTSLATNQYGVAILTIKSTFMFQGVDLGGETIEIANSRKESYGGEGGAGYKPHMVEPATIEEDVLRREFNFNCMTGDTLIPTEQGILRIDQIARRGDGDQQDISLKVAGPDGPAVAVGWQYSGYAPTLTVRTDWGHKFSCTHHHPVLVLKDHTHEWVQANHLVKGDLLCVPVHQITRHDLLRFNLTDVPPPKRGGLKKATKPDKMTPELAYLIGCIVAEGSNTHRTVSFSNTNLNLISRYSDCFQLIFGFRPATHKIVNKGDVRILNGVRFEANYDGYDAYANSKRVVFWLRELGLYCDGPADGKTASHHKVVPWSILQSDEQSQLAFLAAYLDCDGSINAKSGRITYCSSSSHVRQQFQVLLGSHGILSKVMDNFVYLNAVDSSLLWSKIHPWMVVKSFDYSQRRNRSRNRYGIPVSYLRGFVAGRRGISNSTGASYTSDDGGSIVLQSVYEPIRKIHRLLYDAHDRGDFEQFMSSLNAISPEEHRKVRNLLSLKYQYVEVISVEDAGNQDVFDISMEDGVEPAFVANGVLVHNTLLWRLQDLANGPEKAEVVDLTGCGLRDLREGVMSCPRDPNIVFSDDPTRMIRLLKFVGRYGFKVPPDVAAAVRRNAKALKNAPPAAVVNIVVNDVLLKPYARKVLPLMEDLGLTAVIQELMQVDKQFKSTMLNAAFEMPPQLVADLLGYGFESFRPRFLKPHQVALYQKIIGSMSPEDAETFESLMELPPVSNMKYINMFSLKGPDRALPAEYAREALLADPDLDRWRAGVLDEVVLARFNQVRGLVAAWGAPLFKGE